MIPVIQMQSRTVEIIESGDRCSLRGLLSALSSRWVMDIAHLLMDNGTMRFNAIRKGLRGATPRSLSRALSLMTSTGLVERLVVSGKKVQVFYYLTAKGERVLEILMEDLMPLISQHSLIL